MTGVKISERIGFKWVVASERFQVKRNGLWIGRGTIAGMDGRKALAKAFKRVKRELTNALGGDVSLQQEILIERVVFMVYKTAVYENSSLKGDVRADEFYLAWANTLRRTLESLGLKRVPKEARSLQDYIEQTYGKEDSEHN